MSILVVWASPNQDGLTSAAKDNILKGLSEAGGEAEAGRAGMGGGFAGAKAGA